MKVALALICCSVYLAKAYAGEEVACEKDRMRLKCEDGEFLEIESAIWGRQDAETCPAEAETISNTTCTVDVTEIVNESCGGLDSCKFRANKRSFGNPCPDTYRYVTVKYQCRPPYPVIHMRHKDGHYKYSWKEGKAECEKLGLTLATLAQMQQAYEDGLDVCACGHTAGGDVVYPIVEPRIGCGTSAPPGLRNCPENPADWGTAGWDIYCNSVPVKITRFTVSSGMHYQIPDLDAAKAKCLEHEMVIATRQQVQDAFENGYDMCACGFVENGEVVYPITNPRVGCWPSSAPGLRDCPNNPSDWNQIGWDVYCYSP